MREAHEEYGNEYSNYFFHDCKYRQYQKYLGNSEPLTHNKQMKAMYKSKPLILAIFQVHFIIIYTNTLQTFNFNSLFM